MAADAVCGMKQLRLRHHTMESEQTMDQTWKHVLWLASEPRPEESDRLEECRQYCERHLSAAGWKVERRPFAAADSAQRSLNGINLVARRSQPQQTAAADRPVFVLGAHLDSRSETPGADDNASAVAALLETARVLNDRLSADNWQQAAVDLELVVFDLEEHGMLGGVYHADSCRQDERNLCGMVSLEMLGYCSHEPGSQSMPEQLQGIYPDVGNFIGVVGNQNSSALIQHFGSAFESVADLPHESLQVPDNGLPVPPTRLSDHSPFWDAGYSALMITDTSFMRNPHYHLVSDTPETLDPEFLAKVTDGVIVAMQRLLKDGLS